MNFRVYSLNSTNTLWCHVRLDPRALDKKYRRFTESCIVHEIDARHLLLINALSGAADYVTGVTAYELGMLLGSANGSHQARRMKRHFLSRGYLYANGREEQSTRRMIFRHYVQKKNPLEFFLTLTTRCNFACRYCYQTGVMKTIRTLSPTELTQCLDGIRSCAKSSHIPPHKTKVCLYGGEPFLPETKHLVRLVCERASQEGWTIHAITNGYTLIDYLDIFSQYRAFFGGITVTLDGPERIHNARRFLAHDRSRGTFRKIVKGIDLASSMGIRFAINVNLDPANIKSLKQFTAFLNRHLWAKKKNIRLLISLVIAQPREDIVTLKDFTPAMVPSKLVGMGARGYALYSSKFAAQIDVLLKLRTPDQPVFIPRTFGCRDVRRYVLHVDGNIYPCLLFSCLEKHAIGRWTPRWHISKHLKNRFYHINALRLSKCRDCSMAGLCGGPCPAIYLLRGHTPNGKWCTGPATALAHVRQYLKDNEHLLLKKLSSLRKPAIAVDADALSK